MSDTTANEVRSVEAPVKEPDELESDSEQNELESQQWGSFRIIELEVIQVIILVFYFI